MIRVFKFKNNYYQEHNAVQMKAEWCSIGYFDALDTYTKKETECQISKEIFGDSEQGWLNTDVESILKPCDYFIMVGICEDEDETFWDKGEKSLILISFIRLKKRAGNLEKIQKEVEEIGPVKCYLTYESSDLIVCIRCDSYSEGGKVIKGLDQLISVMDEGNGVQKSFSVLVVRQCILDELDKENNYGIKDENVQCYLRGIIKNRTEITRFCNELRNKNFSCVEKEIPGSDDIVLEVKGNSLISLLQLYRSNGLLTHWDSLYDNAFYNIRTEIIMTGGMEVNNE